MSSPEVVHVNLFTAQVSDDEVIEWENCAKGAANSANGEMGTEASCVQTRIKPIPTTWGAPKELFLKKSCGEPEAATHNGETGVAWSCEITAIALTAPFAGTYTFTEDATGVSGSNNANIIGIHPANNAWACSPTVPTQQTDCTIFGGAFNPSGFETVVFDLFAQTHGDKLVEWENCAGGAYAFDGDKREIKGNCENMTWKPTGTPVDPTFRIRKECKLVDFGVNAGSVASLVEIRGRRNLRVHRSHPTGGWNRQGDHAMTKNTATSTSALLANEAGYDPIEDRLRQNIRATIEAVFEEELEQFLGRCRYGRSGGAKAGYRHGHRERQLVGTFGTETVRVPRARITGEAGKAREWRSKALPRYQRLTKKAEALIAAVYLSGTNTRRVKRALFGLFQGAVSKDVVSRAWRKVKVDWQAWCARSLADEDIVRLILDGTVIKTRIDRKATNISVLAAIGVRRDGQKVLLSLMNMGGESTSAWRQFINDLDARGLKRPEFVIVDGAPGLEVALIALWGEDLPIQRCTVHKHRNLLAKAPKRMHDELTEDYRDMIYAKTPEEIATRRKAFLRKWRLKCKAVADSLEEAGDKLFTFTRLPQGQWKSARTTNAIERLNEEFRRRIKTQTVLPCAETVPMLLWALMASGQIVMRKVDGWETLAQPVADATLDQAA